MPLKMNNEPDQRAAGSLPGLVVGPTAAGEHKRAAGRPNQRAARGQGDLLASLRAGQVEFPSRLSGWPREPRASGLILVRADVADV